MLPPLQCAAHCPAHTQPTRSASTALATSRCLQHTLVAEKGEGAQPPKCEYNVVCEPYSSGGAGAVPAQCHVRQQHPSCKARHPPNAHPTPCVATPRCQVSLRQVLAWEPPTKPCLAAAGSGPCVLSPVGHCLPPATGQKRLHVLKNNQHNLGGEPNNQLMGLLLHAGHY